MLKFIKLPGAGDLLSADPHKSLYSPESQTFWKASIQKAYEWFGFSELELFPPANDDEDIIEHEHTQIFARAQLRSESLSSDDEIILFCFKINIDPRTEHGLLHPYVRALLPLFEAMSKGWCQPACNEQVRKWQEQQVMKLIIDNAA